MDSKSFRKPKKDIYSSLDEMPDEERAALKAKILDQSESYFRRTTNREQQHELFVWDSWGHFYD